MEAKNIISRLDSLVALRQPLESTWRECYEYTFPLRGDGLSGNDVTLSSANTDKARMVDSTATEAAKTLASGIMSGLTPPSSRWFTLDVIEATDEEQTWLDSVADSLFTNIHAANFDSSGYEACLDIVCAGWFAMYVEEDKKLGGLNFQLWPLGGVYVASTKADGLIDTIYRKYKLTAAQVVSEFEKVSDKFKDDAEKEPNKQFELIHAIFPREQSGGKLAKNLPFASFHVLVSSNEIVRESGYHEFPCVVPRWMLIPNSCYGAGAVNEVLPDVKELNELKRMEKAAADLAIGGMWIAKDDGVLNPRTVQVGPRKIIIASDTDAMRPLTSGSDFNVSFTMAKELQANIRKGLMADQLQPQDGPTMTATEVHVRVGLIRQLLGPVFGRLQAEYLQPMIERCFGLAWRAGVFGDAPESLAGRDFHVRYISPLARAQKLEDVSAIDRLNAAIAQLAQAKPEVLDLLDGDETVRYLSESLGVPSKVLRDKGAVQMLRQQREQRAQQQQQQAQQAQAMQMAADATGGGQ